MLGGNHVIDDFGFGVIFKQATRFKVKSIVATSNINPAQVNQQVTLTAIVSGAGHTPTGTVTFKKGQAILGTVALTNGQASLITVFPKRQIAAHIQAEYSGDANYLAIRSVPIIQVMNN